MNNKGKAGVGIALGVALTGSIVALSRAQQKERTETSGVTSSPRLEHSTAPKASREPFTPAELAALAQGRADLANIRRLKNSSQAVSRLLPYLRHPIEELRLEAVRMLGRLEDPAAEQPLAELVAELDQAIAAKMYVTSPIPPAVPLRTALARIRTRQLKGVKRLEDVAQSLGITQDELVKMSQQVNGPEHSWMQGTHQAVVVEEFVDLMVAMLKRGENISDWTKLLTLSPVQKVMLEAAPLPLTQEIDLILDSFSNFAVRMDREGQRELTQRILEAGPPSTDVLIRRLEQMQANPQLQRQTPVQVYEFLFRLAAQTGDPRVPPLLKEFEANPKPWPGIRDAARQAREQMEQ